MSTFKELYNNEIKKNLMEKFNYSSVMQAPKLDKIVVNIGVGDASHDSKFLEAAAKDLEVITGQKPIITKAKKSIAGFKLREGQPIGVKVTFTPIGCPSLNLNPAILFLALVITAFCPVIVSKSFLAASTNFES